ncbi:UPF0481 protein At3g47200-like [Durio zibethinus]|uniref:UPF0481 protein At3g47200-like n=1 Tax=Durio zibethinus TaxID=66656 RepID=A0A6P6AH31_DURZI|nr:UPF0481 protein At3g47200-like [Durio zibethinus]
MMSNQGQPGEVIVPMPEIEQLDFISEQRNKLKSALLEANNHGSGSSQRAKPLIQRVPRVLMGVKEDFKKYFEPRLVALGPLHHGNPKFERAERSKLKFTALFVRENDTTDDALFNKIMVEIEDLKKCYDPEVIKDYDNEKLAWMFFMDGCAVLYAVYYGSRGEFEKLKTKVDLMVFAQLDLFLLENQLPYRVLEILIKSAIDPKKWEQSITGFIGDNLITNIPGGQKSQHADGQGDRQDYAHLLERLRTTLLTGKKEERRSSMIGEMILSLGDRRKGRKTFRSIKELKESGIYVKPSKRNSIKNISFSCNIRGRLMMPHLLVDDSTAPKFMNLVALEMCPDFENDFAVTSYLCFLDSLIDTAEDVKELRVRGVLHNYVGSDEEVANLFNKMSRDLVPDQEMYFDVAEGIRKYCNNPLTISVAQALYTHFSSPWSFLALLGAILGLLFSAIQAYFSLPQNKESGSTP